MFELIIRTYFSLRTNCYFKFKFYNIENRAKFFINTAHFSRCAPTQKRLLELPAKIIQLTDHTR